ncbi:Putative type-1 restriction enzyme specificity protein MG438 [Ligilactobacillus salivarius]|nr:Putative type-1 restriction enzyme specificity protein MG438 [Ligilactobacillus salivarius]
MAKEEKKAPKLRFNGYTNDWEQQELGAVVEFYSGLTYKPENVVQNGTLVIRSSNIHNNQYINADNVYVKNNIVNSEYVQEQDIIVVVRNGSRNLIGKHALLKSIPHDPSVIGAFMTGIRSLNNQFIEAVLNTEKFKREINKNLGATINQITTSQFKKMKFNFPKREEDKQIGILFNYLDDTIQLHERKCEELILIKKALLQKLFPKRDEVRSEVRYKNFSDAWKQRKLRDVVKTTIGEFVIKTKQKEDSPYPVYNGGTSYTGFYDDYNNDSNKIIISARGANAGFVNIVRQRYWAGNSCYSLSILNNQEMDLDYLYQMLKQRQHLFTDFQQAANIPSVSKKDVETFKVYTPSFEEQKKIGLFLTRFDSLIDLHQRKLEKLKQLKKFLLQNMFI